MVGHGRPRASRGWFAPVIRAVTQSTRWAAPLLFLLLLPQRGLLAEETMRVRIAWGGGVEQFWQGAVSISRPGRLSEPRPLGIEADEPGSMWLEPGGLIIRQRSPRTYDGVDLLVTAPLESNLLVQLTTAGNAKPADPIEIPLADLRDQFVDKELDQRGNRLLVRRTPGDRLRVTFQRSTLIFSPGERFHATVRPHLLAVDDGTKLRLRVRLQAAASDRELWSQQHEFRAGTPMRIPVDIELPDTEGVYDMVVTAKRNSSWPEAVRRPLNWKKTVAERKVQLLVLDAHPTVRSAGDRQELQELLEIDPTNSRWWERLAKLPQLPKTPALWKRSLGNGNLKSWQHPLGKMARLNPNRDSPDSSWEAYRLPIDRPGLPHVLEVDYPSDVPQTMGISILEPNAAGALMPITLDSGIDTPRQLAGQGTPRLARHRLIFWPRTTTPMVLICNLQDRLPAVYGKIRVLSGWEQLPKAAVPPGRSERLWAAYLDRPLFPENFSAAESYDAWSGRSLDDWTTFYQGGSRLVEYLQHVGCNSLMISVLADGSTIYPSKILQPTPRYDTGVFFSSGADPIRKDVLEMLLRMFDTEGLKLVAMIEFATPLPELETIRRRGEPGKEGIEWIGPDGKTWCQSRPTRRALAPYYNVLHPRVQNAMLKVIRELIGRYSHHSSFAAVAIRLSAEGYTQLPGPEWGMDDATIARFEQDTELNVPGTGPDRFARRAALLNGKHRRLWLEWRAGQLSRFYRRAYTEIRAVRPDARLYLAGAGLFAGPDSEGQLRPTLPRKTTIADALLQVGIDVRHYENDPGLVLLRPERIMPTDRLSSRAVDLEVSQMPDIDQYFRSASVPGSLFFHQPRQVRITSFDRKSPFRPTYTWLVSQPVPSGEQNRKRFAHSLATLDAQVMVDGGWLLPLGQEGAIRDMLAVYRCLPAVRFHRVNDGQGSGGSQPVTFRSATFQGRTYVYAVNDSPLPCEAEVRLDAPPGCRCEELTGSRCLPGLQEDSAGKYWRIKLKPYDLAAVRLSAPGVAISRPQVALPRTVAVALRRRISELGGRTASLRVPPPPLGVLQNPDFEQEPDAASPIPGWATTGQLGVGVEIDKTHKHSGVASARLASNGPIVCLVSRPFDPPKTGRLSLSVWLRVADAARQPPLRLAIQGKHYDHWDYYRAAPVGLGLNRQAAVSPIGVDWRQFIFPVNDLPLEELSQLQVRFDLMGEGEVWIDEVQLSDLRFSNNEVKELSKLVTLIHVTLLNGQFGDCLRLLDGYWPRFLEENVPLRSAAMAAAERVPSTPAAGSSATKPPKQPAPRTGLLDRVKNLLPERLRF